MNIKNLTLTTVAALTISVTAYAQTVSQVSDATDMVQMRGLLEKPKNSIDEILHNPSLSDSPFWNKDFVAGKIIDSKDNRVIDVYIRYRILDDVIQVKSDAKYNDDDAMNLARSEEFEAVINNQKFRFYKNYPIFINSTKSGYALILLESDKVSLIKRISQEFIPEKKAENSYTSATPPKLNNIENYFIDINNKLIEIKPHKKKAADAFPDHQDEIKSFIKKNKLKFRGSDEEADLTTLVEYYSTL